MVLISFSDVPQMSPSLSEARMHICADRFGREGRQPTFPEETGDWYSSSPGEADEQL